MFNTAETATTYVAFAIARFDLATGTVSLVRDEATGGGVMLFRDLAPCDPKSPQSAYNRADAFIEMLPYGASYQVQRVRVKTIPVTRT